MSEFTETPASREQLHDIARRFGWTVTELPNCVDVYSHVKRHRPNPEFPKPDFDTTGGYPEAPIVLMWHNGQQFKLEDGGWQRECISAWSAQFMFDVDLADREIDFSLADDGIVVFPPQPE